MSFGKQPGVLQMVWYSASTDGITAATDKYETALALLGKGPGFEGVHFDGTVREEPGKSLRVLRWSSFDASRNPSHRTICEGADQVASTAHYEMYNPTPLEEMPECIEFVTIKLKPSVSFADFYQEWAPALKLVSAFDGCRYAALGRGIEDPHHLIGFKQAPNAKDIMSQLYPVIEKYVEGGKSGMKGTHIMLAKA